MITFYKKLKPQAANLNQHQGKAEFEKLKPIFNYIYLNQYKYIASTLVYEAP